MKGSGKTLERRKEDMFDEYERFRANGNEYIQAYFIRFYNLVNDMKAEAFLADVECTTPYEGQLAITTTNMFQANHEDAYDSDVDDGLNASIAFMTNFSSVGSPSSSNNISINE
nr:hypothetical protein [Tanacetum cinerariifolium]